MLRRPIGTAGIIGMWPSGKTVNFKPGRATEFPFCCLSLDRGAESMRVRQGKE